jgi:hypothetical protein
MKWFTVVAVCHWMICGLNAGNKNRLVAEAPAGSVSVP